MAYFGIGIPDRIVGLSNSDGIKNKVDAWKAVSNRFKSISINNDESEIYDMVATVLNRDKKLFEKYIEQHSRIYRKYKTQRYASYSF